MIIHYEHIWLVVWNHGILWLSIQLGISSSQLTIRHIFQRGRSTTNQINVYTCIYIWVNYNELTTSSLEIIVSKGNHPQMALIQVSELL